MANSDFEKLYLQFFLELDTLGDDSPNYDKQNIRKISSSNG